MKQAIIWMCFVFLILAGCVSKINKIDQMISQYISIQQEFKPEVELYATLNHDGHLQHGSLSIQDEHEIKLSLKKEIPIKWKKTGSWFIWTFLGNTMIYHWYFNHVKDTCKKMSTICARLELNPDCEAHTKVCKNIIDALNFLKDNFELIFSEQLSLEAIRSHQIS